MTEKTWMLLRLTEVIQSCFTEQQLDSAVNWILRLKALSFEERETLIVLASARYAELEAELGMV